MAVAVTQRHAVDYDLRSRLNLTVTQIETGDIVWNDAAGLVGELIRDPYSHTFAALAGYQYVPAPEDVLFYNWVDATAQMHHQSGKVPPRPVKRPWAGVAQPKAATQENLDRRKRLAERLGLSGAG